MTVTKFRLPDVLAILPFDYAVNPYMDTVGAQSYEWVKRYGIIADARLKKRFQYTRADYFVAAAFPTANAERYRLISDWHQIAFALDDVFDLGDLKDDKSAAEIYGRAVMHALDDPDTVDTRFPAAVAIADFWKRFIDIVSPSAGCRTRFIEGMRLFVESSVKDCGNRGQSSELTLEEHAAIRRDSTASRVVQVCNEVACEADLPDHVIDHPVIRRLRIRFSDIGVLCNDLYSFNGEQASGQTTNFVTIAMSELGLDLQAAVDYIGARTHAVLEDYLALKHTIPSWGPEIDAQVQRYVQGLEYTLAGNVHWSFGCRRYFGAEVEEVKRTLWVTLLPQKVY